jgi:Flp pilus assembly pilin Flp
MHTETFRFHLDHRAEEGQAMVEYALILGLVSVAALATLTVLSANLQALLDSIAAHVAAVVAAF